MTAPQTTDPTLAFVFPGQGSQSVGMLAELSERHSSIHETFAEASEVARGIARRAECGPGKVLGGLIKRIDGSIEHRPLGTVGGLDAALGA